MRFDVVLDGPPPSNPSYLLAAAIERRAGELWLERKLSPLAWRICDYLYGLAYRDRHANQASSVSYLELLSRFRHAEGEETVDSAVEDLQTTYLASGRGKEFSSGRVVQTEALFQYVWRFRMPDEIQKFWAQLDQERLSAEGAASAVSTGANHVLGCS